MKIELPKSNSGRSPIVLAYGIRWNRELWEKVQKRKLPQFNDFRTVGVYFYYWRGQPIYTGIGTGKLHRRISAWHKEVGDDWDSFSWFVIDNNLFVNDLENLCLRALTHLGPGQSRRQKNDASQALHKNTGAGRFLYEKDSYRGYWLDAEGRVTVARESARTILTPAWQRRCRLKRQKD